MLLELQEQIESKKFQNLLNKAERVYTKELEANPKDIDKLCKLGEIHRMKGQLKEASNFYARLIAIDPSDTRANYLYQVMNGQPPTLFDFKKEAQPAPFITISNFLLEEELNAIWGVVNKKQDVFMTSKVRNGEDNQGGKIDAQNRKSKVLHGHQLSDIKSFFLKKVLDELSRVWQNILVSPFEIKEEELQLTMHKDGDFFRFHKDSGEGAIKSRIVTFVYYFHNLPKAFEGGDLLLFDTNTTDDECTNTFTKITPQNNSLLIFPSGYYHKVSPIHCEENNYKNGRFTLNGWLHDATEDNSKANKNKS